MGGKGTGEMVIQNRYLGTSQVGQWLRHCSSSVGGMGSIPDWGTKTPQAMRHSQKNRKKHLIK